jgi:anti-anti-sigma factor
MKHFFKSIFIIRKSPGKVLEKNRVSYILFSMDGHFKIYEKDAILVVKVLVDKFDFLELSESSRYLRSIFEKRNYPSMIFDLLKVTFIDSSVFGFLLEVHNRTIKNGNKIAIICSDKTVLHVMSMLTVTELIKVFPTMDEAENYLNIK